jgi:hypothetical protein
MGFVLMVRGFGSLDARRGSLERDLDIVILGVWWSEFDWQLFTFLGAIEAMRFVWVAMVTDGADYQMGPRITFFEVFSITMEEVLFC